MQGTMHDSYILGPGAMGMRGSCACHFKQLEACLQDYNFMVVGLELVPQVLQPQDR
jgi:hypothetical protein